jgi:hypothetical protein
MVRDRIAKNGFSAVSATPISARTKSDTIRSACSEERAARNNSIVKPMTVDLHLFSTLAPTLKQAMPIKARLPNISVACVRSPDTKGTGSKSPSLSCDGHT